MRPTYRKLAEYYDRLFPFAESWGVAARGEMLGEILPRISSACDLACGTGTTAMELARRGLDVYAVDRSPTMCEVARKKARRARLPVQVIRGDMRRFRLPERVDLVTCEFDAINHVPERADLARVVEAVARALRPGGYFYFDVNNRRAFEKVWPLTWWIDSPGVALAMHGRYDGGDKASAMAELFVRKGRCWQRYREEIEEVCWSAAEIQESLRQAGFDQIRRRDAKRLFREDPLLRPGYRTYYVARKASTAARSGRVRTR